MMETIVEIRMELINRGIGGGGIGGGDIDGDIDATAPSSLTFWSKKQNMKK